VAWRQAEGKMAAIDFANRVEGREVSVAGIVDEKIMGTLWHIVMTTVVLGSWDWRLPLSVADV